MELFLGIIKNVFEVLDIYFIFSKINLGRGGKESNVC